MKTAYVTGADRGLGICLARVLLEKGYTVFAGQFLKDWPELSQLNDLFPQTLTVLPLDVTNDASVRKAAADIANQTEHLDILINNAGLFRDRSGSILEDLHYDDMRLLYETNCLGPLRVSQSVMPLVLNGQKKLLMNVSSEAGSIGQCWRETEYGYSMSKAALNMQSAILQNHLGKLGVKVLVIHPGWVRSYMLGHFNDEATVEAMESALGIVRLIDTHTAPDSPMYVDYQGNPLAW